MWCYRGGGIKLNLYVLNLSPFLFCLVDIRNVYKRSNNGNGVTEVERDREGKTDTQEYIPIYTCKYTHTGTRVCANTYNRVICIPSYSTFIQRL